MIIDTKNFAGLDRFGERNVSSFTDDGRAFIQARKRKDCTKSVRKMLIKGVPIAKVKSPTI